MTSSRSSRSARPSATRRLEAGCSLRMTTGLASVGSPMKGSPRTMADTMASAQVVLPLRLTLPASSVMAPWASQGKAAQATSGATRSPTSRAVRKGSAIRSDRTSPVWSETNSGTRRAVSMRLRTSAMPSGSARASAASQPCGRSAGGSIQAHRRGDPGEARRNPAHVGSTNLIVVGPQQHAQATQLAERSGTRTARGAGDRADRGNAGPGHGLRALLALDDHGPARLEPLDAVQRQVGEGHPVEARPPIGRLPVHPLAVGTITTDVDGLDDAGTVADHVPRPTGHGLTARRGRLSVDVGTEVAVPVDGDVLDRPGGDVVSGLRRLSEVEFERVGGAHLDPSPPGRGASRATALASIASKRALPASEGRVVRRTPKVVIVSSRSPRPTSVPASAARPGAEGVRLDADPTRRIDPWAEGSPDAGSGRAL